MATSQDLTRYRMNRQNELDAAALYRVMADSESQTSLAEIYRRLALVEEKHARFWEDELKKAEDKIQKMTDGWIKKVDDALAHKEHEIKQV